MINSTLSPIWHNLWDTTTYWRKIANFCTLSHLKLLIRVTPFEFRKNLMDSKTRVFVAVHRKDFVILACAVLIQSQLVTDGWTDRQTDRQTPRSWLRRAKHSAVARKNYRVLTNKDAAPGADIYEAVRFCPDFRPIGTWAGRPAHDLPTVCKHCVVFLILLACDGFDLLNKISARVRGTRNPVRRSHSYTLHCIKCG